MRVSINLLPLLLCLILSAPIVLGLGCAPKAMVKSEEHKKEAAAAPSQQKKNLKEELEALVALTQPRLNGPSVELKIKVNKERLEITNNCNVSVIKVFESGQIQRKKIEAVDFKVKFNTAKGEKLGTVKQLQETFFKDGSTSLHDLAYPELGEKIEFLYNSDYQVINVTGYSKDSLFYVQPLPFPIKAVQLGEEWITESHWTMAGAKSKLKSKIKSTFANWKTCGSRKCAEIKVVGYVERDNLLSHRLTGLFLVEPTQGLVPFAEFQAYEQMQAAEVRVEVRSTLRSVLVLPPGYYKANHEELICPSEKMEE